MNILETLSATLQSAINLRVMTVVGDAGISGDVDSPKVQMPEKTVSMVTNVNMLQGDVTTVMSEAFMEADYAELRTLHCDMLTKAQAVVERNVQLLKTVMDQLGHAELPDAPARQPKT